MDAAAHALDPLVAQPEYLSSLRFGRDLEVGVAVEGRNLDLASERRSRERDRHLAMQVAVVALEHRVRLDTHHDIKIAGRTAIQTRFTFA